MKDNSMKVTPGRYIQGKGVCTQLGDELRKLNVSRVYLLGGERAMAQVMPIAETSLKDSGISYETGIFKGFTTYENVQFHMQCAQSFNAEMIIGIGGGKSIDCAKATAHLMNKPVGTIPTSLATCVACSNVVIMYSNSGAYIDPIFPDNSIEFSLVDMDIIAHAPSRYIASGIVDSMAKYPELRFSQRETHFCGEINDACLQAAYGMSHSTWDILMENGRQAYMDNQNTVVSHCLEAVASTNLLTTGAISGLARGSKQLAIAHAVYNHSTVLFPDTWREYMHGEIVSVGVLLQELYNEAPAEEIENFKKIVTDLHVPLYLHEIGIDPTSENQEKLYRALLSQFTQFTEAEQKRLRECIERIK